MNKIGSIADQTKGIAEENGTGQDINQGIGNLLNVIFASIGVLAVIMIIIGGLYYVTSQGDPGKVKRGKDTILYGIVGLVIAFLAIAIVNFVLVDVFGKD